MAEFVETTVREIDSRLRELESEVSKLQAARAALVGDGRGTRRAAPATGRRGRNARPAAARTGGTRAGTPRRSAARRTAAPSAGGRRSGPTRASQALDLVRARPGITIPEIAKELGIEPNYLYRVMPRLQSEGHVTREGQGWHPAAQADA